MHHILVCIVNSSMGFESLYWTPVVVIGSAMYDHPSISYNIKDFRVGLLQKNKLDIYKYLYYAIRYYHFTPGVNADSFQEWIEVAQWLKKNIGKRFVPIDIHRDSTKTI